MTEQLPDSAEDLTGYYAPHPPIRCAALVDAGPQDGPDGGQGGREGASADAEPSEGGTGAQAGADSLHAQLAAVIRDTPARYPDDVATALLPVAQRETAQLRRERDMALATARRLRALIAHVRNIGPDLEVEATLPGMHDAAREAKRDASRRIRNLIDSHTEGDAVTDWTPPPPGDRREQLPDEILALVQLPDYTSTACETALLLEDAAIRAARQDRDADVDRLMEWADRLHQRCRLQHKFTGVGCRCNHHGRAAP